MSSYPTSTSASGIWQLGDIPLYIQDGAWPNVVTGDVGLFSGGVNPSQTNVIQYITITSVGNSLDFGDLTSPTYGQSSCSNSTRALFSGGNSSTLGLNNVIDYVNAYTKGNAADFGDATVIRRAISIGNAGNSTRGLFGAGFNGTPAATYFNTIDYVTIATIGNATDFGDLTQSRLAVGTCSSPSRAVWAGGATPANQSTMDYVTIASTGNAASFGSLSVARSSPGGASSSTRGIFGGGASPTRVNVIDYITIASTGNATDFGDLTLGRQATGSLSNSTRAVWGGGDADPAGNTNIMDYVTIASTGNALDFGDLYTGQTVNPQGTSNCGGSLQ
jgi:hypothetical protein